MPLLSQPFSAVRYLVKNLPADASGSATRCFVGNTINLLLAATMTVVLLGLASLLGMWHDAARLSMVWASFGIGILIWLVLGGLAGVVFSRRSGICMVDHSRFRFAVPHVILSQVMIFTVHTSIVSYLVAAYRLPAVGWLAQLLLIAGSGGYWLCWVHSQRRVMTGGYQRPTKWYHGDGLWQVVALGMLAVSACVAVASPLYCVVAVIGIVTGAAIFAQLWSVTCLSHALTRYYLCCYPEEFRQYLAKAPTQWYTDQYRPSPRHVSVAKSNWAIVYGSVVVVVLAATALVSCYWGTRCQPQQAVPALPAVTIDDQEHLLTPAQARELQAAGGPADHNPSQCHFVSVRANGYYRDNASERRRQHHHAHREEYFDALGLKDKDVLVIYDSSTATPTVSVQLGTRVRTGLSDGTTHQLLVRHRPQLLSAQPSERYQGIQRLIADLRRYQCYYALEIPDDGLKAQRSFRDIVLSCGALVVIILGSSAVLYYYVKHVGDRYCRYANFRDHCDRDYLPDDYDTTVGTEAYVGTLTAAEKQLLPGDAVFYAARPWREWLFGQAISELTPAQGNFTLAVADPVPVARQLATAYEAYQSALTTRANTLGFVPVGLPVALPPDIVTLFDTHTFRAIIQGVASADRRQLFRGLPLADESVATQLPLPLRQLLPKDSIERLARTASSAELSERYGYRRDYRRVGKSLYYRSADHEIHRMVYDRLLTQPPAAPSAAQFVVSRDSNPSYGSGDSTGGADI